MRVAVIQMASGEHPEKNLKTAIALIRRAVLQKAKWVLLPETFYFRGADKFVRQHADAVPGDITQLFGHIAKNAGIWILLGSISEKTRSAKVYNTSVLINPKGKIQAKYRKMNLFNLNFQKKTIGESAVFLKGNKTALAKVEGIKVGLSICFDLRFPGLYSAYAQKGAQVLVIPSAFTQATGRQHWEALVRARAIENQCYVLAPNQSGVGAKNVRSYGNSLIVDPWGKVLARGPSKGATVLYANLNVGYLEKVRKRLPMNLKSKKNYA